MTKQYRLTLIKILQEAIDVEQDPEFAKELKEMLQEIIEGKIR